MVQARKILQHIRRIVEFPVVVPAVAVIDVMPIPALMRIPQNRPVILQGPQIPIVQAAIRPILEQQSVCAHATLSNCIF